MRFLTGKPRRWYSLAAGMLLLGLAPREAGSCGWTWETYAAEAKSLPCVHDTLVGYFPRHGAPYHRAVVAAVDDALLFAPSWLAGLDAKGLSQMHLGELEEAGKTMRRRLEIAPDAYASHANLGTLHTFTGDHDRALVHVDRALALEPKAHFGREKYHRRLIEFARRVKADPAVAEKETFVGRFDDEGRSHGSPERYAQAGHGDDAIDALVSMIAVYGADRHADVYFSLGELLALRGHVKLAWTAYTRALELGHPRKAELEAWTNRILAGLKPARSRRVHVARPGGLEDWYDDRPGGYRDLGAFYAAQRVAASERTSNYAEWEKARVLDGMPVWEEKSLDLLYERMNLVRFRCRAPGVIDQVIEPFSPLAERGKTKEAAP